jgi:hypothetical protein
VIELKDADGVTLRHSRAASIHVAGRRSRKIRLFDTESMISTDPDVSKEAVVPRER